MLLEDDPCLEGYVADIKDDLSARPGIYLALFLMDSWLHGPKNMCSDMLDFLKKFLPQWLHCCGKPGRVAGGR